jgi:hypothetical protein
MNAFLICMVFTVAVDLMALRATVEEYAKVPLLLGGSEADLLPSEQDAARWDTRILDNLGFRTGFQPTTGDTLPSAVDARPAEAVGVWRSNSGLVGLSPDQHLIRASGLLATISRK